MTPTDPILRREDGRSAVVLERTFPEPIDQLWHAATDAEHTSRWFPGAPDFELRPGGAARFPEFAGSGAEFGTVLDCRAPQLLRFTWDTDTLTFELREDGEGTSLVLTHAFDDHAGAASYATGWEGCLAELAAVVAGAQPPAPGPRRERHEQLARAFDLSRPGVEASADGWVVRFERQLVCPVATAWELFLGGAREADVEHRVPVVGEALRAPQAPEVVLGTVTAVQQPMLLAFAPGAGEPGEQVRLELTEGTGHGGRMHLVVQGTDPAEQEAAIEQWRHGAVEAIAAAALATAP